MPTKAPKKKMTKKTRIQKKPKAPVYNLTNGNLGLGFPKKLRMVQKYSEAVTATSTGTPFAHNFVCNGLFDVNQTGGGHQPMYFDQMMALYDHFTVIGSKINVKVIPTSATVVPSAVGVYINDDFTATPATLDARMEQSVGRYKFINNQSPVVHFVQKWSGRKAFGKLLLANTDMRGDAASNPVEIQAFTIFGAALDGLTTQTWLIQVNIEYIVIYTELKDISSS